MNSQWKRLALAAMISSSFFAATWFWYKSTENKISSNANEKPLAYVGKVTEDIQRRPASRLLWQNIYNGEPLYNGEAVRTSERGEVRIQFANSDRYLDLEPESLIVIKKSEGEIALDLMEGSLFVNAKGGEADQGGGLVLNSADGKVDLSRASASLSKTKGRGLDLQVLEGQASIQDKNGKSRDFNQGASGALGAQGLQFNQSSLKILAPLPQKPIYLNAEDVKPVAFQWRGFPPKAQVSLWWGSSRREMKEFTKASSPDAQEIQANVPLGKYFWKLVAHDQNNQVIGESPVYRVEILARYAPTVVFPIANAEIPKDPREPYDMTFKWQKGDDVKQITLEIWKDANLKQKIATQSVSEEDTFTFPQMNEGIYYWRMTSYFNQSETPVLGKVQKFSLLPNEALRDAAALRKSVPVQWTHAETQEPQYFVNEPEITLDWKVSKSDREIASAPKSQQISSWKVTLQNEDGSPAIVKTVTAGERKLKTSVAKAGRYIASIEAVNKFGDVLGTVGERKIQVSSLPLIAGPRFTATEGPLKAGNDGRADLQWSQINGAKEYSVTISKDGKELKKLSNRNNTTALRNLMPGEYEVQLNAVDTHGRPSEPGESRKLIVPDSSNIKAPTLKKIKVN